MILRISYGLFLLLSQLSSVLSLDCYLCADNNLDEFGECKQQFRLDCSSYAKKFSPNEKIFCRTTRQKSAQNSTYTIMKECIAERAHYQNFPKKNYELDEECDLVEIDNYEIAYCLCKSSLCNEPPIVDQFTNFEKKYPELFGKSQEEAVETEDGGFSPLAPTQETIEDPFVPPPNINGELRRQPTSRPGLRQNPSDFGEVSVDAPGIMVGPVGDKSLVDGNHESMTGLAPKGLTCSQCGQANLTDELSDCNSQISIDCAKQIGSSDKNYCFTRQVIVGAGQNAVEKMCVSEQAIMQEFNMQKVIEGCESTRGGRVRYCICSSDNCNSLSILEQFAMSTHLGGDHSNSAQNQDLAEMTQHAISDGFEEQKPAKNLQITSLTPKIESPPAPPAHRDAGAPAMPEPNGHSIHCQVCAEDSVHTDGSDCLRTVTTDCATQSKSPKTACLTRQTLLSTGNFAVEKRCINEHEAEHFVKNSHNFDGKELKISPIGTVCGITEDGSTKFCLCDSDMCNRFALKEQIQQYDYYFPNQNSQTSTMPVAYTAIAPTSSTRVVSTRPQTTTTTETEFEPRDRQIDGYPNRNVDVPATRPSNTIVDDNSNPDLQARIQRWKDSATNSSSINLTSSFISNLIMLIVSLLVIY